MARHGLTEKQLNYLNALQKAEWFSEYETTDVERVNNPRLRQRFPRLIFYELLREF